MRVDEFSVQKLTESDGTTQQLTSQIQELQERVNCMQMFGMQQTVCKILPDTPLLRP